MDVLHVFPTLIGGEGVHLDAEGHSFLPAVLPGRELGADAVHLWQRWETPVCLCSKPAGGPRESRRTWMNTEAFLTGSQRNSAVLRCRGCEQGSRIPTDSGISANIPHHITTKTRHLEINPKRNRKRVRNEAGVMMFVGCGPTGGRHKSEESLPIK